tara:strand:- start:71616 stop:73313 length:1698 start_codon:yes stop_codon:yes gene_type:complete
LKTNNALIYFFLLNFAALSSQQKYPQNYFRNPLNTPMILAGTFGELRSSHFHSGIDLKTQQREGLKVLAAAEGYVSRIKISNWGYGKALYITHPNGFTTVYAHLKEFNKKIEAYTKAKQYELEKTEIQLFPKKGELLVTQEEVIAYSGSTGGFIAPHLHFEIRDSQTEKVINPMHFGLLPKDVVKPKILAAQAYALQDSAHVNGSNRPVPLSLKQFEDGNYLAEPVKGYGSIGFGVHTYDRQDGSLNKNGVYKINMKVNGKTTYEHKLESFSFGESKYLNLLIDFAQYAANKKKYQKTYIHPENKLSIYKETAEKGRLQVKEKLDYQVVIKVSDFKQNTATLTIPVVGVKKTPIPNKEQLKTNYFIKHNEAQSFENSGIKIEFPKNAFYEDFYFDFRVEDSIAYLHTTEVPLNKSYDLSFDVSSLSKGQHEKGYISRINQKGKTSYCPTSKIDSVFKTSTKNLGRHTLSYDEESPEISNCSFYKGQNLTGYHFFSIYLKDALSGIKTYRGEIDEKWILLERNVKTNKLTYNFHDKKLKKGKHTFTLFAVDNVGNTRTFTSEFRIK